MLSNFGPWQILICVLVAFVLFGGGKKLPEFARSLGKSIGEFKKGKEEGDKASEEEVKDVVKSITEDTTAKVEAPKAEQSVKDPAAQKDTAPKA